MRYQRFFETHDRLISQKQISLIKSDMMDEFLASVVEDPEIEDSFKALVLISISGGLRVSEAFSLTSNDFIEEDEILYVQVSVLKKRRNEKRWARIHPKASSFIKEYIDGKVGAIIKMSQSTGYRKMRLHFGFKGVCNHSLRHSNISYMLFIEGFNHMKLAKLLHINLSTIEHYSHLNEKRTLRDIFKNS